MSSVYVNLQGGLGNQLFQVSAGYAHARKYSKSLYIDPSGWDAHQGVTPNDYKNTIFRNFVYETPYNRDVIGYREKDSEYNPIPDLYDKMSIGGYFQSRKYFENWEDEFIESIVLPTVDSSFIQDKNVAFHIRRGDYLKFAHIHHVCKTDYFDRCFEMFEGYQINVFTDSPEHVLKEFEHQDFNLIQTSSELNDLTLISHHDNVVCSNSSFSWWGSFLGKTKNKIIVPDKWFGDGRKAVTIYRDEFIKLPV